MTLGEHRCGRQQVISPRLSLCHHSCLVMRQARPERLTNRLMRISPTLNRRTSQRINPAARSASFMTFPTP